MGGGGEPHRGQLGISAEEMAQDPDSKGLPLVQHLSKDVGTNIVGQNFKNIACYIITLQAERGHNNVKCPWCKSNFLLQS